MRFLAVVFVTLCIASSALAAPKADLWARWQAHDADATATIDHSRYDAFLNTYVVAHENGPNGVRYADVDSAGRQQLETYLQAMQNIHIDDYNRDVQRAFWINLYNAATLDVVLKSYPVESIRDIGGGLFSSGPWDDKIVSVEDEKLSLNDIEHRILRPIWHDGMTHYGVNCASMSCPSLSAKAYTGENVDSQLRANARDYINSPQGVDLDNGRLTLSKIYDWYGRDFGGTPRAIISHLREFAAPELSAELDALGSIDGYTYDWALNEESAIKTASINTK
ncbi:DUF547 domain-containing protein [Salinisphaera aquimarina]|uniref:DUF547 domain-containing protein n=1 Tax=Salinisphaera aquimarina TaxID=2094031 RepID=A0ABV7ELP7_9GAMM